MSSFDIAKISRQFEILAGALSPGRRPTPADRELYRMYMADIRRFIGACEMNRTEVEAVLAWKNREVRR
jgi:hypothetical protein